MKVDLSDLADKWPSTLVYRGEIGRFTGGLVSGRTVANADSKGAGPEGRFRIGRKTAYRVHELIKWLESRANLPSDGTVVERIGGGMSGS